MLWYDYSSGDGCLNEEREGDEESRPKCRHAAIWINRNFHVVLELVFSSPYFISPSWIENFQSRFRAAENDSH